MVKESVLTLPSVNDTNTEPAPLTFVQHDLQEAYRGLMGWHDKFLGALPTRIHDGHRRLQVEMGGNSDSQFLVGRNFSRVSQARELEVGSEVQFGFLLTNRYPKTPNPARVATLAYKYQKEFTHEGLLGATFGWRITNERTNEREDIADLAEGIVVSSDKVDGIWFLTDMNVLYSATLEDSYTEYQSLQIRFLYDSRGLLETWWARLGGSKGPAAIYREGMLVPHRSYVPRIEELEYWPTQAVAAPYYRDGGSSNNYPGGMLHYIDGVITCDPADYFYINEQGKDWKGKQIVPDRLNPLPYIQALANGPTRPALLPASSNQ